MLCLPVFLCGLHSSDPSLFQEKSETFLNLFLSKVKIIRKGNTLVEDFVVSSYLPPHPLSARIKIQFRSGSFESGSGMIYTDPDPAKRFCSVPIRIPESTSNAVPSTVTSA